MEKTKIKTENFTINVGYVISASSYDNSGDRLYFVLDQDGAKWSSNLSLEDLANSPAEAVEAAISAGSIAHAMKDYRMLHVIASAISIYPIKDLQTERLRLKKEALLKQVAEIDTKLEKGK